MVDKKYFGRTFNIKCNKCGYTLENAPHDVVENLETAPDSQELRCSKGCNTRGSLRAHRQELPDGRTITVPANWQIIETTRSKKKEEEE